MLTSLKMRPYNFRPSETAYMYTTTQIASQASWDTSHSIKQEFEGLWELGYRVLLDQIRVQLRENLDAY